MTAPAQFLDAAFSEGALVRGTNDLCRCYGVGRIQKVKGEHAKVEYNPSVFMQPPYRSDYKIPRLPETERIDAPLERAARGQWDEPWRFELKVQPARFLTGNKGGQLSNARRRFCRTRFSAMESTSPAPTAVAADSRPAPVCLRESHKRNPYEQCQNTRTAAFGR
jgi:hypothetical protein